MIFDKGKVTVTERGRVEEMPYELNSAKKPKWIDVGDGKKTQRGIYDLDGDKLRICFNETLDGERPTEFSTTGGTPNDLLLVLERVKK